MKHRLLTIGGALVLMGVLVAGAFAASSATSSTQSATAVAKPIVYETKLACCQSIVIGSQSSPTLIAQSPTLATGKYLVHATVGVDLGANDNVVCATTPDSLGQGNNDGIFGGVGNGASSSPVYGSDVIVDTWKITTAGDKLDLVCNVTNPGAGTTASEAVLELVKIGTLYTG
jgi:hypothetical protein